MINQEYIKELTDLAGYIFEQIEIPDLTKYIPYMTSIGSVLVILIVAIIIFNKKRAVREYIVDAICIKIQFPEKEKRIEKMTYLLKEIYEEIFRLYKHKYHFALELLKREHETYFFIVLPQNVFFGIRETILKDLSYEVVTTQRERFIEELHLGVRGVVFELQKDFVFPLKINPNNENKISLGAHDWIFMQIVCRGKDSSWKKAVEGYKKALQKGHTPSRFSTGCCGGCLSVAEPFLSFLASMITTSVHGDISHSNEAKLDGGQEHQEEFSPLDEKFGEYGFEVSLRVFSRSTVEDRAYALLENYLSTVSNGDDSNYNTLVVSKVIEKVNRNTQSDLILAYLAKNCIDILNEREIVDIVETMYKH